MEPRIANDGWVSVELEGGVKVHVRVGRAGDPVKKKGKAGEWPVEEHTFPIVATAVLIEADDVTTDTLRQVQPSRILAAVGDMTWRRAGGGQSSMPAEQLLWIAAGDEPSDDETTIGDLRRRDLGSLKGRKRRALGRPDGKDPDRFYRRFAEAYRSAATESNKPAVVIAEENGVPVETVRRWTKEARRRCHMAGGTKGRAR